MNNKKKILKIWYLVQRMIAKEDEEQWVNSSIPRNSRRGVVHTQARKLRTELNQLEQTNVKIRVIKIVVYHDKYF